MIISASCSPARCHTKFTLSGSTTRFLPNASFPASTTPRSNPYPTAAEITDHNRLVACELSYIICGTASASSTPTTVPPMVISSGMMKWSKSMNVAATSSETNTQYGSSKGHVSPKRYHTKKKSTAVSSSTSGYRTAMGFFAVRAPPA